MSDLFGHNRLSEYEETVIALAEDLEMKKLQQSGGYHAAERKLIEFIFSAKREKRRLAAKEARHG